ncbi:MAG: hypothetical protein R3190_14085 [Thermoanaerobaculia bacterium]|nr:hypothetical protein [Thermoanaerobaculia bacterium]
MTDLAPPPIPPARDRDFLSGLAERLDLSRRLEAWAPVRFRGDLDAKPALCLDDFSAIPFLDVPGAEEYQHRARVRAHDGDVYAAVTPPCEEYEDYCRDHLRLGRVKLLAPEAVVGGPMEVAAACLREPIFSRLVAAARAHGGLRVHPYMGIERVWELALALAAAADAPVEVLAPPPPVTWIANDKGLFSELVAGLLGPEWIVETRPAADAPALAAALRDLAGSHREVALKRLRCASATGNKVYASGWVRKAPSSLVVEEVRRFLERTEWDGSEEVLAVAWEQTPWSPSTQIWIPPVEAGPPILEGIYEQILKGDEGIFVGSRPSTLPEAIHLRLGEASLRIASALQELGYVGRCSFDHLVIGDPAGEPELRFTECNGRWGGTSIPMSLVDRLVAAPRPCYRAQDVVFDGLVGASFGEIAACLGTELFDPGTGRGRFVLYNPGPLRDVGKIDVVAFGASAEAAEEAMLIELPRLLGV